MSTTTHPSRSRRSAGLLADDRGVAMLEFCLVSPILCYMIVALLFFRNHIDYAQDSVLRARAQSWAWVVPDAMGSAAGRTGSAGQTNSDDGSFIEVLPIWVREAVVAAGAVNADGSVAGILAAERYYGLGLGTPYDNINLKRDNYRNVYIDPKPIVEEPWAGILSGLGVFFGNRIGGGTVTQYEGLSVTGWKDRFPEIVNPWMQSRTSAYSTNLDPADNILVKIIMTFLNGMTFGRTPTPRIDTRQSVDIGRDRPSFNWPLSETNSDLELKKLTSKSTIKDAIQ